LPINTITTIKKFLPRQHSTTSKTKHKSKPTTTLTNKQKTTNNQPITSTKTQKTTTNNNQQTTTFPKTIKINTKTPHGINNTDNLATTAQHIQATHTTPIPITNTPQTHIQTILQLAIMELPPTNQLIIKIIPHTTHMIQTHISKPHQALTA
jgi:hypothetical protein